MATAAQTAPVSKKRLWAGRVLSALPAALLVFSAVGKLMQPPAVLEGFAQLGYQTHLAVPIGILELSVAVLYMIPRTAVLGAILVAAYLGGATATHVRAGDGMFFSPVILGIVAWLGLWLREERLHALLPLRK